MDGGEGPPVSVGTSQALLPLLLLLSLVSPLVSLVSPLMPTVSPVMSLVSPLVPPLLLALPSYWCPPCSQSPH